jgi:hypothetical protein
MTKVTEIRDEREREFLGDLYGQTKLPWQQFFELQSERQRDRYAVRAVYQRRRSRQQPCRNGYYERDFVTSFGTIRLRIARTREKSLLPGGAAAVSAASGRGVDVDPGSILAWDQHAASGAGGSGLTGEVVSTQTVSKLTRDSDEAVRQFHQARLSDDYAYLFLDGVSLRVRGAAGRKRVHSPQA